MPSASNRQSWLPFSTNDIPPASTPQTEVPPQPSDFTPALNTECDEEMGNTDNNNNDVHKPSELTEESDNANDNDKIDDLNKVPPASTGFNLADETADLNFTNMAKATDDIIESADYKDITGQSPMRSSDHRPTDHNLKTFFLTVFRGRAMPSMALLAATVWSAVAVVISYFSRIGFPPHENNECRWWCTPLAVDSDALSYVGFALFLLTSFRVSEAYSRYMEAARVWTTITGTISSFAKYVMQAFPDGMIHKGDRERMLSFLVSFPVALKRDLRGERDLSELKCILTTRDLARIQNADSMPSYCLAVLSSYLLKAKESEHEFPQTFIVHLIKWVADLAGSADICTQIKTMPAPYSYVTHLKTFLGLWLFFLPFAIVEVMGWGTIVLVAFISYGILGVLNNATELEDPFGSDVNDLPLGRMSLNIIKDVSDIYEEQRKGRNTFLLDLDRNDQLLKADEFWLNLKKNK